MIPLVQDTINEQDLKKLAEWILTSPRLTKGELTKKFESEWAKWNGNRYAVFVNSGSSANLLMAYAMLESGRLKNKKVIVPAVSWVTTVSPFIQLGFEPILCDCDENYNLDPDHFLRLCDKHRPALAIGVHVLGCPMEMGKLLEICKTYGVYFLEDCCEAHGSTYDGSKVGTFGLMGSFSFYFGHHMSTIEGGMVVTDDEELYNIMLSIRSHGWSRDLEPYYKDNLKLAWGIDKFKEQYSFYYPGFNLRSTDLNAFLGLEQLKRLDKTIVFRNLNYLLYVLRLHNKYRLQKNVKETFSAFALGLTSPKIKSIIKKLTENEIESRPLICGSIGEQPFWIKRYGKEVLPNATIVHNQGFYVPCNQSMTEEDINKVCSCL